MHPSGPAPHTRPVSSESGAAGWCPENHFHGRRSAPVNVLRCPVCRQECIEADVMENVFVKDSVETPSSTMERTVQVSGRMYHHMGAALPLLFTLTAAASLTSF